MVLEKTLESPLDFKEIQSVHPKGDQSFVFIGLGFRNSEAWMREMGPHLWKLGGTYVGPGPPGPPQLGGAWEGAANRREGHRGA